MNKTINGGLMKLDTWKLKLRLGLVSAFLFGMLYILMIIVGQFLGIHSYQIYFVMGLLVLLVQYLLGPKIVESTMGVRYLSESEAPELHRIVGELANAAGIPKPKVGVSNSTVPNAFAFGRTKRDGRVCVTQGILNILEVEELKAVLGHEIAHIKNNDMAITTLVSAIPLLCYYLGMSILFSDNDNGLAYLVGILALIAYFLGQLLVLLISRIREYYADQGSVELGSRPEHLASALYKLVYGSATANEEDLKAIDGVKAFFVNDINDAKNEINDLADLDINRDGRIDYEELKNLKYAKTNISFQDKVTEALSTHPNMVKRIKRLSEMT